VLYVIVSLTTLGSILLARITKSPILLPVCTAAGVYYPFIREIQQSFQAAFTLLLFWSLLQSALVLAFIFVEPDARWIWKGREYTDSMFRWIESGDLPEGSAVQVIFFHAKQTILYVVLAIISANLVSLILGSSLLNYMNYYVAHFARRTSNPLFSIFMGWNPWSIVRVVAFLWLGVVCGSLLLRQFFPIPFHVTAGLILPPIIGVIVDVALKLTMGRWWSFRLKSAMRQSS
jgi:hypothetical protein